MVLLRERPPVCGWEGKLNVSEDKTQNGYEGSQELDFQDAKEMTVGEAVRKEAEIKAGVTETDSILDKYIKQHL